MTGQKCYHFLNLKTQHIELFIKGWIELDTTSVLHIGGPV